MQIDVQTPNKATAPAQGSSEGVLLTVPPHGRYYEAVKAGRVFVAHALMGTDALIFDTEAGQEIVLWNPPDSGVNLSLLSVSYAHITAATGLGDLGIAGYRPSPTPITETTAITNTACLDGSIRRSQAHAVMTATLIGLDFFYLPLLGVGTGAITVPLAVKQYFEFDGLIQVPEGGALALASCSDVPTAARFVVGFTWEEIPRA